MTDTELITTRGETMDFSGTVEQAEIAKLMAYMIENNIHSFNQACKDVGLVPRTVKRWLEKPENAEIVRTMRKEEVSGALAVVTQNLEAIAAEQVDIALTAMQPRDRTRAATWVQHFLELHGELSGDIDRTPDSGIKNYKQTFELNGPITIQAGSIRAPK